MNKDCSGRDKRYRNSAVRSDDPYLSLSLFLSELSPWFTSGLQMELACMHFTGNEITPGQWLTCFPKRAAEVTTKGARSKIHCNFITPSQIQSTRNFSFSFCQRTFGVSRKGSRCRKKVTGSVRRAKAGGAAELFASIMFGNNCNGTLVVVFNHPRLMTEIT